MDSRQPHSQPPFARNNAASPSYKQSPFPPAPGPPPTSSSYPPRPTVAPAGGPATSPVTTYSEHNVRRPSDSNPYYPPHGQSRAPPATAPTSYPTEPTPHPAQAHSRHPSTSSTHNAAVHRVMPPPSPQQRSQHLQHPQHSQHPQHPQPAPHPQHLQHLQHTPHGPQHQAQPPHQMGPYGNPPAPPHPPPVNLGPPSAFPPLSRVSNAGGMPISAMLGGPPSAHREPTAAHAQPYLQSPASASSVAGAAYGGSVHASPRMQNASDYSPYSHRRPQTPEPGRPPFESRDQRGSAAGSPPQGTYGGTPEMPRYGTPQTYSHRPPPKTAADDNKREASGRGNSASVPSRPSSQPRSYHGMAPRSADMGRGPPPPHGGDLMYTRREEGPPPVEYNVERGQPRPVAYDEQQHRAAVERDYREQMGREAREAEFRNRDRRERERLHLEGQRAFITERERYERDRERERDRDRDMEMQRVQRERTSSDPTRPPGPHPAELGPPGSHREPQLTHYGRPDPRDPSAWQQRAGYDLPPREAHGQSYIGHRPAEYTPTTGHPYGSHPAYAHAPPERFPPTSQPPPHGVPAGQPAQPPPHPHPHPHPFDSPDRLRFAPPHTQHHPQHVPPPQPHQHPLPQQSHQPPPQRALPPGGRPGEEGPPPLGLFNGRPGGVTFETAQPRPMEDGPGHAGPPRALLGIPELNRKGRLSPIPQPPVMSGPGTQHGIKSEFGRMFSGIGSGVRGIGVSSPGPAEPPVTPFSNPNFRRSGEEAEPLTVPSEAAKKPSRKRAKAKEDDAKGDDDSTGRATPVGRKRTRTHAHHHHHQYHHHHHHHPPHHHAPERTSSPLQGVAGSLKGLQSTEPVPSPTGRDFAFAQPHQQPPRSHPHSSTKAPDPGPTIVPRPTTRVSSRSVIDSVAHRPRKHLGDVLYSVVLKPVKLESTHSKLGFSTTPRPLPMDLIKGNENSTLTVKVPRVHLTPPAREEITARRALWGTEVYTDDSDVVAACIHAGWIRGEWSGDVDVDLLDLQEPVPKSKRRILTAEEHLEEMDLARPSCPVQVPPDRDLHVKLLILPALDMYSSTTRFGIQSREFGGTYNGHKSIHDGLSFMILSVRWVDGAAPQSRLRGKVRRERIHKATSEANRGIVLDLGEKPISPKAAVRKQDSAKAIEARKLDGQNENEKEKDGGGLDDTAASEHVSPVAEEAADAGVKSEKPENDDHGDTGKAEEKPGEEGVEESREQKTSSP
ncbi:Rxt3-domain-containing protein [Xylariaceae sp. FL0594]|nr:Rxt3-domain-containing protein [Xylariaceae sp. FL0594]